MTDPVARANHAKALLADEVLQAAFADVRADMMREWEHTPEDATAKREGTWRMIKAIDRLKNKLEAYMADGAIAARR